jgi:hypothetical protein
VKRFADKSVADQRNINVLTCAVDNLDLPDVAVIASPEEAIQHPDVDLVVLASPNATHAPLARLALNDRINERRVKRFADKSVADQRNINVLTCAVDNFMPPRRS